MAGVETGAGMTGRAKWDDKLNPAAQGSQRDARDAGRNAGRFIGTMAERDQGRQAWINATEALMAAAARGGSIDSATDAVPPRALFLQGKLEPLRKMTRYESLGPSLQPGGIG